MKKPSLLIGKPSGFALIATILLMVLLAIITVGTLSLSVVTLRSGTQDAAQAKAQANARMALMIAIGELQRNTGSDTRVTASANLVDKNYPEVLGVWKSWEGTDHDPSTGAAPGRPKAPDYEVKATEQSLKTAKNNDGRFVNWLVSTAATKTTPSLNDPPSLVQTSPSTDTIPLLAGGSLQATDTRQIHVIPTHLDENSDGADDGRLAWWVSGENQKALLAQPYKPRTEDAAALAEMGQSHTITNPAVFGIPSLITDPEPHNPSTADAKAGRKAVSRQTMALLVADNAAEPQKKFHDLSPYSIGLLTNTATGGWRKDLSILTERWDAIYASYPGGRLPLFRYTPTAGAAASSQVPKPVKPAIAATLVNNAAAVSAATPPQSNLYPWSNYSNILGAVSQPNTYHAASASWQSMVSYATSYKNLSTSSSTVKSPFVWDSCASQGTLSVQNLYNYKHTQRLSPQIARFQFLVYARAEERTPVTNPKRYDIKLSYVPIFTLWNPYNISIEHNINSSIAASNQLVSKFLGLGWRRAPPGVLAVVNKTTWPNPALVPNNQYRCFTPGNFQVLDRGGNNVNPYDNALTENTSKGYNQRWVDKRTYGCWLPNGTLTFKPGEAKIFSPTFIDTTYGFSGVIRLREGYQPTTPIGTEFVAVGNQLINQSFWFLMKTDKFTQPFIGRQPGIGFSLSFGNEGPAGTVHYGGGSMPTAVGQNELHNITSLASGTHGMAYWPPTEVDEVGYSVAELASGPWIPIFSIGFGPRTTIGTGPGTEQSRSTKGVVQSNPLAAMSLSDPGSGAAKDHPASGTYDLTYHSLSIGSTITPNVSNSNGYIATGYQSGDGLSRLIMCDIPLRPMASLVELQGWNPRGNNPYPPFQHNLIGNSDATPLIPRDQIIPPVLSPATVATNLVHDDVYCANHLLFDDWFVSSIAPQPYSFGGDIEKDINTVYGEFLKGERRLTNRTYLPITTDSKLTDAEATTRIGQMITSNDGWLKVASRFEVEGMFNVNTTSVEAWKAILGHAKSLTQIAMHGADEVISQNVSNKHVVTRGSIATDVEAGSGAGVGGAFANASEYTGFRSLSDDQIENLAEKVVEQVRLRGPFLSLSEFVNRQLSSNDDLALAGAIQSAINNLTEDPMATLRNPANSLADKTMLATDPKLAGVNYEFSKAAEGSSAYGAPGWIRQADILRPIAPILTVRDDTFTIRAYGDSLDKNGKVVAQAWCEAVVKRSREFIDQADSADSIDPPLKTMNTTFGRHYDIISFRWLNPKEV